METFAEVSENFCELFQLAFAVSRLSIESPFKVCKELSECSEIAGSIVPINSNFHNFLSRFCRLQTQLAL